jgi:integrase
MELRPGLKDVRRPAALMHSYITLSLLSGIRTEEARALRWAHVDLDGDPAASPPVPPHVAVWRSVRTHGETKTERSRRTLALPQRQYTHSVPGPAARPTSGWRPGTTGRTPGWYSRTTRAPRWTRERPEDVQASLRRGRHRGRLDTARAAHHFRQLDEPPRGSASRRSPASSGTPPPAPPRSSTAANYAPLSPPAPRSWTSSSAEPNPAPPQSR